MKLLHLSLFIWAVVLRVKTEKVQLEHRNGTVINFKEDNATGRSFTMEIATSYGSLHFLNDQPPMNARVVIFLGCPGTRDGKAGSWEFHTVEAGSFCLGIFHHHKSRDGSREYLEFAGQNCFQVWEDSPLLTLYEIPREHTISVKSNSVVGIIYPSKYSPRCITMETQRFASSRSVVGYSEIMVVNPGDLKDDDFQGDDFLLPGTVLEKEEYAVRDPYGHSHAGVPSFKVIVMGPTNTLQLQGGKGPHKKSSGVAMIFLNNQWGTICDKWYHFLGWPQLFCDEKDYPSTEVVTFNEGDHKVEIDPNTPILMHNPHCKESGNTTMMQCRTREDLLCTHKEDIFIKCHKRVKLMGVDNIFGQGICMLYESNYWGSICDSRGPYMDRNGGPHHWAHACCREVGFMNGAIKLKWADHMMPVTNHAVSMHSPVCTPETVGNMVDDFDMCQDAPAEEPSCSSKQDIYVYCDTSVYYP